MWNIHTMKYYSALKRKAILTQAAAGMNLEGIMLSDVSETQKNKQCLIHSYKAPRAVGNIET